MGAMCVFLQGLGALRFGLVLSIAAPRLSSPSPSPLPLPTRDVQACLPRGVGKPAHGELGGEGGRVCDWGTGLCRQAASSVLSKTLNCSS